MYSYIDYEVGDIDSRIDNIERAIDTDFFHEYFDVTYDPHPNKKDVLSENDNVCQCLERMADYILSSDEEIARKKKEKEYIYFNSREHLNKKLQQEISFSIILPESKTFRDLVLNNILEDDVGRIALSKDVMINDEDYENDVMGKCLKEYSKLLTKVDEAIENGGNRKALSRQKYYINQDMKTVKRCYMAIDNYQHDNINVVNDYRGSFDLTNPDLIYGFNSNVHGKNTFVPGLLFYNKDEGLDCNSPLSIALHDIDNFLKTSLDVTERDRRMISLLREGVSRESVGKILKVDISTISRSLQKITNKITEGFEYD